MKYIIIIISILFADCSSGNSTLELSSKKLDTILTSIKKDTVAIEVSLYDTTNFSILDSVVGNLNLDVYPDKILILKDKNERLASDVPRPLLILIGQPDKSFKVRAKNDNVVLCADCGGVFGDPYQGLAIKNGFFSVEHYGGSGWRWTRIITFKYSKREDTWYLHRDAGISYHNSDPNTTEEIITNKEDFDNLLFVDYNNKKGF